MGLFDWLTGTRNSDQGSSSTSTQDSTIEKEGSKVAQSSKASETGLVESGVTSQLDADVQEQLKALITSLTTTGGNSDFSNLESLVGLLTDRASTADQFSAEQIAPIIENARRTGLDEIKRNQTELARRSGSSLQTHGNLVANEGVADLESQLAAAAGQLALQGRASGTQELGTALSGEAALQELISKSQVQNVGSVGSLAQILKGAQVDTSIERQQTTGEISDLLELVRELAEGQTTTVNTGQQSGSQSGTLFDLLSTGIFRS